MESGLLSESHKLTSFCVCFQKGMSNRDHAAD